MSIVDPRIKKMAKVLASYSLNLKKGDFFVIQGKPMTLPLIKEVYRQALKVGANPYVIMKHNDISEIKLKEASDEQLNFVDPFAYTMVNEADAVLNILGDYNTKQMANVDAKKMEIISKANRAVDEIIMERAGKGELKWSLCQYPTHADAQESNMSLDEYADFVFEACLLDKKDPMAEWNRVHDDQQKIINYLKNKDHIEVKSKDTHITLRVGGRTWINSDGHNNFPSGEVFTAPIKNTVEGHIRFSFPGIYMGKEIEDISLTFEKGKVVKAEAAKGEDLLHALLETDEGSKYIGEFAIGTNYGIKRFTKNMLFDEKIGGTIHMALGVAYPESGGKNKSSIHWDMLCDMKDDGEIYADGELFYKDGKFIK